MSNLSEQATINFYTWEARGRGYYLFDKPIELEPPYIPFVAINTNHLTHIDDGKVSFFDGIKKLISPSQEANVDEVEFPEITPYQVDSQPQRECIEIQFPNGTEISLSLIHELLSLLSFSESSFSFEMLSQKDSIAILFTCSKYDLLRLTSQLKAFFPNTILTPREALDINFDLDIPVAIADFGLNSEFMLPMASANTLSIDPLTSIIATLETLEDDETGIFQILFKGVTAPWSQDMMYSVSDGRGGSFFEGYPEFVSGTKEKVSYPLFSVGVRIAIQGHHKERSSYLAKQLAQSITSVSSSEYNKLIPLSNEGYDYDDHLRNVFFRTSNRLGCILNVKELAHFVHYPNKTIISNKLSTGNEKTKRQSNGSQQGIYIGENIHLGKSYPVHLDTETRLSHSHIIGSTGVGKSTLIANMMLEDINQGLGCALFDPHGDICDDVLKRIPEHRINDVIVIDPSDIEFPIGFNLLEAHTDTEKIVLSSDLVSAFKCHASAWGDNMTAVLQNVISTLLDSKKGGTLIELKRFLIEEKFRNEYLLSVDDPSLHYYWKNEYPMMRKGISPLLTRIDTFLRPKIVRYMLAQKKGVEIAECLKNNSIVLLKLSQGLIGEQNSYLLGSLFLAKFNQAALSRQAQHRDERKPYMLYLDEFQNFITPSIERILSGARKYGLGITIAHQELGQVQDSSLLNSVLSNPKTRICFRLGDSDAKRLESGFSYFEQSDLQSLERGKAIMRIGSSNNDFNLDTLPLMDVSDDFSQQIISRVKERYSSTRKEVENIIISLLPNYDHETIKKEEIENKKEPLKTKLLEVKELLKDEEIKSKLTSSTFEQQKESYLKEIDTEEKEQIHRDLQHYVRKIGQQRGFVAELETLTQNGGRIDVTLRKDSIAIAVEISVTNTSEYEVDNIKKCLDEEYSIIYVICESKVHLSNIKKRAKELIDSTQFKKIKFGSPSDFMSFINKYSVKQKKHTKNVRGYRVKTNHVDINSVDASNRNKKIQDIILRGKKKK